MTENKAKDKFVKFECSECGKKTMSVEGTVRDILKLCVECDYKQRYGGK